VSKLSHLGDDGAARMVDVSAKADTERSASAQSIVVLSPEAFAAVMDGTAPKGDVLAAARIAGIMAAKRVPDLIPLCHPLAITGAGIEFQADADRHAIAITATVKTFGKTGVEMEALTAASVAALTIYDMVKAVDKGAVIESTRLLAKSGGKSGEFKPAPRRSAAGEPQRKSAAMQDNPRQTVQRGQRPTPTTIMGEVTGPRAVPDESREAFRAFMMRKRMRATTWAKDAGVPVGEILGFLTGKSRRFSAETAAKLAHVAKVTPEDMFR
jgi:cyclic pyranopterin phosphate synthase